MDVTCPKCSSGFHAVDGADEATCPRCSEVLDLRAIGDTMALTPEEIRASERLSASREQVSGLATADSAPVTEFAGYQIQAELGRGGMGVVYRAFDPKLKRTVALKVLIAAEHASAEEIRRFFREAESAARLQHPNIVPIHDLEVHEGRHYYTMDYVEGQPLEQLLKEKRLDLREALALLEKVCRGLEHAHANGIVHRDLKPSNIIVDGDGEPRIFDFGLAKVLGDREALTSGGLTRSGVAMGTPHYMAPEQASGRSKEVDPRTDVYATGCIIYEALTGSPPFVSANAMEVIRDQVETDPVPPRNTASRIPVDVETICLKCLEKEPARRYQSAGELAEDIRRFLDGKPIAARPASLLYRVRKRIARNLGVSLTATAAIGVVGALALAWMLTSHRGAGRGTNSLPVESGPAGEKPKGPVKPLEPVRLTAMRGNGGWTISFQFASYRLREVFCRVGSQGEFRSTGHARTINRQTGLPMPNCHTTLPLAQEAVTIFVKYTDAEGKAHGPFALRFDPGLELLASTKSILNLTRRSWVAMREYDGKLLLYFTHLVTNRGALKEVRYSLDSRKLDRVFPLPPGTAARIPAGAKLYLSIPTGTKKVCVKLRYRDDTESEVEEFTRP